MHPVTKQHILSMLDVMESQIKAMRAVILVASGVEQKEVKQVISTPNAHDEAYLSEKEEDVLSEKMRDLLMPEE